MYSLAQPVLRPLAKPHILSLSLSLLFYSLFHRSLFFYYFSPHPSRRPGVPEWQLETTRLGTLLNYRRMDLADRSLITSNRFRFRQFNPVLTLQRRRARMLFRWNAGKMRPRIFRCDVFSSAWNCALERRCDRLWRRRVATEIEERARSGSKGLKMRIDRGIE